MESGAGILDSSATLGMTSFNKFRMSGKGMGYLGAAIISVNTL